MSNSNHKPTSLVKNSVAIAVPKLAGYVFSFLSAPVVLAGLGLRQFGIWALTGALAQYAALLDLGVGVSLARYIAAHYDDRRLCGEYMAIGWLSIVALALILGPAAILGAPLLSHVLGGISVSNMRIVLCSSVLLLCCSMSGSIIVAFPTGHRRMVAPNIAISVGSFINFAASVGSIALGAGLPGYALANTGAGVVGVAIVTAVVIRTEGRFPFAIPGRHRVREFLSFAIKNQLVRVMTLVNYQSDKVVIAFTVGPSAAGAYELANRVAIAARDIGVYASSPITVELTHLMSRFGLDRARNRYGRLTAVSATLVFPPMLMIIATAPLLLEVWLSHAPPNSAAVLVSLTASYLLGASTGVGYALAVAAGEPGIVARSSVAAALANIVLTASLAPLFGIWGVLAGTVVALTLGALAQVVLVHRRFSIPARDYVDAVVPPLVVSTVLALPLIAFCYTDPVHGRGLRAVALVVLGTLYLAGFCSWAVRARRLPASVRARILRAPWIRTLSWLKPPAPDPARRTPPAGIIDIGDRRAGRRGGDFFQVRDEVPSKMTTTSLSRRGSAFERRGGAALLAVAACVIGLMAGRLAISHYGKTAIEALIVVPVLIALIPRPLAALVLLLVLVGSVFAYDVLPRVNLPGHPPVTIADFVLLAAVGGTLWRRPWRTWPAPVRRFQAGLLLLLVLALVPSIRLALQGHAGEREAITGYKDLLYLAVGLTVALELSSTRMWNKLLGASIVFAAILGVLSILAAASGSFSALLAHYNPTTNVTGPVTATVGTARIRLPGLYFVYAMTIPTLVMVFTVRDRWRVARIAALCLMVAAIAVSLNRNMYFGGGAALLVALVLGGPKLRHRLVVSALAVGLALAIIVQSAVIPAVAAEVSNRAQSALSSNVLASGSAQAREDEFSHAFSSISANPWYGVGWYQNYGAYLGDAPRGYVEDWYLDLATDMGIPVALAFLAIPWIALAYGLRRIRAAIDPAQRALVAAGIASVVALLLSALVGTYLQDPGTMAIFGIACGMLLGAGMRATTERTPAAADVAGEPSVS